MTPQEYAQHWIDDSNWPAMDTEEKVDSIAALIQFALAERTEQIEQAILADRQSLQSEIVCKLEVERAFWNRNMMESNQYSRAFAEAVRCVQLVFAQQLNESNNQLSLKVAQLEKEKNELIERIEELENSQSDDPIPDCTCALCRIRSANRKA